MSAYVQPARRARLQIHEISHVLASMKATTSSMAEKIVNILSRIKQQDDIMLKPQMETKLSSNLA